MPSGQPLVLWQVLWERVEGQGTQAVLRFIAPGIAPGGGVGIDAAQADMDRLCQTHGVPVAALGYARSDTVVLDLMDRPVPRGETDREATRYVSVYSILDGACVPENF
ncbi:acetolactate synthase [Jannaschia formosa]|nr:acetolactate synthase [Jannaschia formosa]